MPLPRNFFPSQAIRKRLWPSIMVSAPSNENGPWFHRGNGFPAQRGCFLGLFSHFILCVWVLRCPPNNHESQNRWEKALPLEICGLLIRFLAYLLGLFPTLSTWPRVHHLTNVAVFRCSTSPGIHFVASEWTAGTAAAPMVIPLIPQLDS